MLTRLAFALAFLPALPALPADMAGVAQVAEEIPAAIQEDAEQIWGREAARALQTLRSILELYKIQHADTPPTVEQLADWSVLLGRTDLKGLNPNGRYGPYLTKPIANPITGKTAIAPVGKATQDTGWVYYSDGARYDIRAVVPGFSTRLPTYARENIEVIRLPR